MTQVERLMNTKAIVEAELEGSFTTKQYKAVAVGRGCCSIDWLKTYGILTIEKEPIQIVKKVKSGQYDVISVGVKGERIVDSFWSELGAKDKLIECINEFPENEFYIRTETLKTINGVRYWYSWDEARFLWVLKREIGWFADSITNLERKVQKDTARLIAMKTLAATLGI